MNTVPRVGRALLWSVLVAQVSLASGQSPKHPFGFADWAAARSANPVAVSPDGVWILYSVSFGADKGMGTTEWHLMHPDGTGEQKIDLPKGFGPAGFASNDDLFGTYQSGDKPTVAIFAAAGLKADTKPLQVIPIPGSIRSVSISPDGKRFAAIADPMPKDPLEGVHTVIQAAKSSIYVVDKNGDNGRWWGSQLRDVGEIAWSSDSSRIAALSAVPKIGYHIIKSWIDVVTDQSVRNVATIDNSVSNIAWVGTGNELAFTSTTTSVLTPDSLYTVSVSGGKPIDRTPKLQGSVMGLKGDAHGNVWVNVDRGVQSEVDRFVDGKLEIGYRWPTGYVGGAPVLSGLAASTGQLVFSVGDPEHSANLAVPAEGTNLKRITQEGDALLAAVELGEVRVVHWKSKEGVHLEGIATFPPDYKPGKRYPFVVLPHGGPEGNDVLALFEAPRYLAALGYVVLQPQYRGSTGYGSEFLNSIYQHFGDRAYRDVDSATDYAISQGWADPDRLAMFGWSAGGFMTAWTVTQTHRYKAAIDGAGITDWGSFMWTSDNVQFDYDARWPDRDPHSFEKFSAVMFADNVTTPLLLLHGEADIRVPTYQAREFFEELLAKGKTVRMVTFPGSGHFPSLWEQRQDFFRELGAWLKKYDP